MDDLTLRHAFREITVAHATLGQMLNEFEAMWAGPDNTGVLPPPAPKSAASIVAANTPASPVKRLGMPSGAVRTPAMQAALSGKKPLPASLTKSPNAKPELSAETRAASLAELVPLAKRIISVLGKNAQNLREGLMGQAALNHIATDDAVIDQALYQAQQES